MGEWAPDLERCNLCPRNCGVNRKQGRLGACHMPADIYVARASLHMWEEPCISGKEGSGTVFFSGCPLGCVYCQNREISGTERLSGIKVSSEKLAGLFLDLQRQKANNINLVTPTHYAFSIKESVCLAKKMGLSIPVVYNTGGYELPEAVEWLKGTVDIYLTDFKYMSPELAGRYSGAPDYACYGKKALEKMVSVTGPCQFDERGMLVRGVIVRHLLLPGALADSKKVVRYLWEAFGNQIYISLLSQYTPGEGLEKYPELKRRIKRKDYNRLVDYALSLGIEQGFIQEEGAAKESFIPSFQGEGVAEIIKQNTEEETK